MKIRIGRKSALSIAAGVVGAIAVAAPALATTQYVGGGTWVYGVGVGPAAKSYSEYYHGSKAHRSSVQNSAEGIVRSDCVNPGNWSYASELSSITGNKAFWSTDACA